MRDTLSVHCEKCGREIRNVKPEDIIKETDMGIKAVCICCGYIQHIPFVKDSREERF